MTIHFRWEQIELRHDDEIGNEENHGDQVAESDQKDGSFSNAKITCFLSFTESQSHSGSNSLNKNGYKTAKSSLN